MIQDPHDKTNYPHKLLLTDRQVSRPCKAFANNSSANIESSKNLPVVYNIVVLKHFASWDIF